jgi:hypothetical protein
LHKDRAAANVATAMVNHRDYFFRVPKFVQLALHAPPLPVLTQAGFASFTGDLILLNVVQRLLV